MSARIGENKFCGFLDVFVVLVISQHISMCLYGVMLLGIIMCNYKYMFLCDSYCWTVTYDSWVHLYVTGMGIENDDIQQQLSLSFVEENERKGMDNR